MKLTICGDICPTDSSKPLFLEEDLEGLFGDTLELFKESDRVLVNLECALTETDIPIKKCGPNLKGSPICAKVLKDAGVTDCSMSNNHIFDYGIAGMKDTIAALEDNGLLWTGIGENEEDSRKNHIIEVDSKKIAIVAVCEHEYTYALPDRMGARPFDPFDTMIDICEAKKESDFVVVLYHGGKELCEYPSPRLRKLCHAMAYHGADVVLCQHSHCIGTYEKKNDSHILYGQGNFHFIKYIETPMWGSGLIVQLNIKDKMEVEFHPCVTVGNGIRLAKGEEKQKILNAFWKRSEALKNDEWLDGWRAFCEEYKEIYTKPIAKAYTESATEENNEHFAHYLDCEVHTDVWRELFPTWNLKNEK